MIKLIAKCAFISCISLFVVASSVDAETPATPMPVRDEGGHGGHGNYNGGSRGREGAYRNRDYPGQRRYRDRGYDDEGGVYFNDDGIDYDDNYYDDGDGRFDSY